MGEKVQFVVIGPGDFAVAANLPTGQIPPNIRIAGRVSDARQYFSAFDVFALPSRYEGFAYVCLEAIAARVPMVVTRVSGSAELIDDEQTGIVVPNEDDTTEFTRALARLTSDETLRDRLRKNCDRAQEKFSVSAMVGRTVDLYYGLLTERK
jgi:glycosyltransferase involved in cell wall biosynthesis